jgi:hypothetical protein
MIEIDHNPHEKRPTNGIWWGAWIVVAVCWVWYLTYKEFDREALMLGGLTGGMLALWALEMKGDNEPPSWLKGKPRVRR